jgi:hypothetical protein
MTLLASRPDHAGGVRAWFGRLSSSVDVARSSGRLDTLSRALWLALIPGGLLFLGMQVYAYWQVGNIGLDSHAYWLATREPETWYTRPPAYRDAFLYSPAFAQALRPLGLLPWPVFQAVWCLGSAAVLGWLLAPLGWRRGLTLAPFFVSELLLGNVYLLFAASLVLGLGRFPGAMALPILTKVAPGVVGVWFLVRGEWRKFLWATGTTAAVLVVSVTTAPEAWMSWMEFLGTSAGDRGIGSTLRLVIALALTVFAARRTQAWLLAPALILACPVLGGLNAFAVLAAVPRLLQWQRARRPHEAVPAVRPAGA